MNMPILQTERLLIRPFTFDDLEIYQEINVANGWTDESMTAEANFQARRDWLEWSVRNYEQLAQLHQPPYGDRAVVLKENDRLIGGCGLVPLLMPFGQLPAFGGQANSLNSTQIGLFWMIGPTYQRQGLATEAAEAIVRYAFEELRLTRLIATTKYTNLASAGVMRRLGMTVEHNPSADPPWMQVVGILPNSGSQLTAACPEIDSG
jgi:RimJ/RimL family protein N-acetyltransferase